MNALFADTGYWIALIDPRDDLHKAAVAASKQIRVEGNLVVTSQMVLTELLNFYAAHSSIMRQNTARFVADIETDPNTIIVKQTDLQFQNALKLYRERPDKQWSLTDCASCQIMEERGITQALTHDHHFTQMGFLVLL